MWPSLPGRSHMKRYFWKVQKFCVAIWKMPAHRLGWILILKWWCGWGAWPSQFSWIYGWGKWGGMLIFFSFFFKLYYHFLFVSDPSIPQVSRDCEVVSCSSLALWCFLRISVLSYPKSARALGHFKSSKSSPSIPHEGTLALEFPLILFPVSLSALPCWSSLITASFTNPFIHPSIHSISTCAWNKREGWQTNHLLSSPFLPLPLRTPFVLISSHSNVCAL